MFVAVVVCGTVLLFFVRRSWLAGFANPAGVEMFWGIMYFVDVDGVIVVGVVARLSGRIIIVVVVMAEGSGRNLAVWWRMLVLSIRHRFQTCLRDSVERVRMVMCD